MRLASGVARAPEPKEIAVDQPRLAVLTALHHVRAGLGQDTGPEEASQERVELLVVECECTSRAPMGCERGGTGAGRAELTRGGELDAVESYNRLPVVVEELETVLCQPEHEWGERTKSYIGIDLWEKVDRSARVHRIAFEFGLNARKQAPSVELGDQVGEGTRVRLRPGRHIEHEITRREPTGAGQLFEQDEIQTPKIQRRTLVVGAEAETRRAQCYRQRR